MTRKRTLSYLNCNDKELSEILLLSELFKAALLAQRDFVEFDSLTLSQKIDAAAATCKYGLKD